MSKSEILAELPKLNVVDRRDILHHLWEMEERDLIGSTATEDEKILLDREWDDYQRHPDAGSTWEDVKGRIRNSSRA
jgi:putative addiction module component (TIGR02574 family)